MSDGALHIVQATIVQIRFCSNARYCCYYVYFINMKYILIDVTNNEYVHLIFICLSIVILLVRKVLFIKKKGD